MQKLLDTFIVIRTEFKSVFENQVASSLLLVKRIVPPRIWACFDRPVRKKEYIFASTAAALIICIYTILSLLVLGLILLTTLIICVCFAVSIIFESDIWISIGKRIAMIPTTIRQSFTNSL